VKFYFYDSALVGIELDFKVDAAVDLSPGNLLSIRGNSSYRRRLTLTPANQEALWLVRAILNP
jgi:hypothetical protein